MDASSGNMTVVIAYRDSFTKAVTKNAIVVVLSISINYINAGLIRTFCKHQVQGSLSLHANNKDAFTKVMLKILTFKLSDLLINLFNLNPRNIG